MAAPNAPTVDSPADNAVLPLTSGVDFSWTHNDPESDAQAGWALKRRNWDAQADIGAEEWWNDTARILSYASPPTPVEVDTSTASTATAYSNQRKIDRCQNGVLWTTHWDSANFVRFHHSTDDGATWTEDVGSRLSYSGGANYTQNHSIFIDVDDYIHHVYKHRGDGYIYYRRGTPNAGRTSWTWSGAEALYNTNANLDVPDIVVHREGTGWEAHVVVSSTNGSNQLAAFYIPITISSGGTLSQSGITHQLASYSVGTAQHTHPSIDFNHTGDGKTIAGGTPHLYVAWSSWTTGAGNGIRFKKATYSGGSWTWGTEREIDSTRYVWRNDYWLNCMFDGTRVVMGGQLLDSGGGADFVVYERDAADTTTITRVLLDSVTAQFYVGSFTYDGDGNVYVFGVTGSNVLQYRKWTRSTTTFETAVTIDSTNIASTFAYASAKRGYSDGRIEFIYTDGTASPYSIKYGVAATEAAQGWHSEYGEIVNAGTDTSKTISDWPADGDTYQYAIATSDDTLGAYSAWRSLNPYEWWDGSAWVPMSETFVTSAVENVTVDGGTFAQEDYLWTVATKDDAGLAGPYAAENQFTVRGHRKWGVVHI